jgi:hypothetical protein
MFDFNKLNGLIGTPELIARGAAYETPPATKIRGGRGE